MSSGLFSRLYHDMLPRLVKCRAAELKVYLALGRYVDWTKATCFPSWPRLVGDTGLSRPSIARALKGLEVAGLIRRTLKPGRSTIYTMLRPTGITGDTGITDDTGTRLMGDTAPVSTVIPDPSHGRHGTSLTGETLTSTSNEYQERVPANDGADRSAAAARHPVPAELVGLQLYEADPKLCKDWRKLLSAWRAAHAGIDVVAEVKKAHAWEISNPTKAKKNRAKFLCNWLARAQDAPRHDTKGGSNGRATPVSHVGEFRLPAGALDARAGLR